MKVTEPYCRMINIHILCSESVSSHSQGQNSLPITQESTTNRKKSCLWRQPVSPSTQSLLITYRLSWPKSRRRHKAQQKSASEMDGHDGLLPLAQLTVFRETEVTGSSHSVKASDAQSNPCLSFCFLPFFFPSMPFLYVIWAAVHKGIPCWFI